MDEAQLRIEVERIVNLVAGFGWSKYEERTEVGGVYLTLKKVIPPIEPE